MISANSLSADDVLGRGVSLIIDEAHEERTQRLAATLAALRDQPVRIIRVANPLQAKLSLKRILIQVGDAEATGTTDSAQIMQSLIQALSVRHGDEDHVLLIVEGAETLEPEAALSLQTLAATLNDHWPALHVLLVGSSALSELGIVAAEDPSVPSIPLAPQVEPGNAEAMWKPLTWRRTLATAALAAVPLGVMLAWAYPRLPPTQRAAPVTATTAEPPLPVLPKAQAEQAAATTRPPSQIEQTAATTTPSPQEEQTAAAAVPLPQPVEPQEARRVRLRADFDKFLASSGKRTARLNRSQRDALFQEYLTWRTDQTSGRSY